MLPLNQDTSYLLGLLVGGGEVSDGTFTINLPFSKWGSDPDIAAQISRDLLTHVRPIFKKIYNIDVDYIRSASGDWILKPLHALNAEQLSKMQSDLAALDLPTKGQLVIHANLGGAREKLSGIKGELFLSGIFDARASIAGSHRRFTDEAPIVSIEIPGRNSNFRFVVQLCAWLTALGSTTDQILYNHPNQHASKNPQYANWKKGFKVRILVKSFLSKHSFTMKSFATGATDLAGNQRIQDQLPCKQRLIDDPGVKVIHRDNSHPNLPQEVRGKVFLHYFHICAAMGCPYAPVDQVKKIVKNYSKFVSVFPLLQKSTYEEALISFENLNRKFFEDVTVQIDNFQIKSILSRYDGEGYGSLTLGLAYLVDSELKGRRTSGNATEILEKNSSAVVEVRSLVSDESPPIFLGNKNLNRGVIVSSHEGLANQRALTEKIEINGIDIRVK